MLTSPEIVFQPNHQYILPTVSITGMMFPSCRHYYLNKNGDKIAAPADDRLSLEIWYSMNSDYVFPLKTVYANAREEHINCNKLDCPDSAIPFSMKNQLRQIPDSSDWFFSDRFQMIISQSKRITIERLQSDIYRYPLNPSSDAFSVARLLELYIQNPDETQLRRYLSERGVVHLKDHPFGYYPLYYLFFLLTRFASYPFSDFQLQLAQRRLQTSHGSPARLFIDTIFDYDISNPAPILQIVDAIIANGPLSVASQLGTDSSDWVRWGDEYILNINRTALPIENIADANYILAEKLYTWSDIQVKELCNRLRLVMPFRSAYPNRFAYIADIGSKINRYRADPADVALWNQQVLESSSP